LLIQIRTPGCVSRVDPSFFPISVLSLIAAGLSFESVDVAGQALVPNRSPGRAIFVFSACSVNGFLFDPHRRDEARDPKFSLVFSSSRDLTSLLLPADAIFLILALNGTLTYFLTRSFPRTFRAMPGLLFWPDARAFVFFFFSRGFPPFFNRSSRISRLLVLSPGEFGELLTFVHRFGSLDDRSLLS